VIELWTPGRPASVSLVTIPPDTPPGSKLVSYNILPFLICLRVDKNAQRHLRKVTVKQCWSCSLVLLLQKQEGYSPTTGCGLHCELWIYCSVSVILTALPEHLCLTINLEAGTNVLSQQFQALQVNKYHSSVHFYAEISRGTHTQAELHFCCTDILVSYLFINVLLCVLLLLLLSGFSGLWVPCWPLVPKFAGSNPA